jgi:branched-chain amino acid aminotransferase
VSKEFKVWFNGALRPFEECTISIRTHALHYGSSVFEGIRAYETHKGTRIFRLDDHLKRFFWSAEVYRMPIPYSYEEIRQACLDAVQENGLTSAYLRPVAFRGDVGLGLYPGDINKIETAVIVAEWGTYLGEGVLDHGVEVCVSSWQRVAPNTIPAGAKAGGNYLSSFLIVSEARERGFTEGIALGTDGLVSEGSGENVFVVSDGRIITPPGSAAILSGITRSSAITLARNLGYTVEEQSISREQLYGADEIFMTGTAVEITPVRKVDHMVIGNGSRGPVTKQLQDAFFGLFDGKTPDQWGWLE